MVQRYDWDAWDDYGSIAGGMFKEGDGGWVRYDDYAALQAENERLKADRVDLEQGLRDLYRAYVSLLESGRDRITSLGGDCDPVDVMEQSDIDLRKVRDLLALIDGQAGGQIHPDTDRLNFIEDECLAVEAVSVRTSEDDADVAWVISQHHQGRGQVVLHHSHDDNLRRAIDAVMRPLALIDAHKGE